MVQNKITNFMNLWKLNVKKVLTLKIVKYLVLLDLNKYKLII